MAGSREFDEQLFVPQSDGYDSDCFFVEERTVTHKSPQHQSQPVIKNEPDEALQVSAIEQIPSVPMPSRGDSYPAGGIGIGEHGLGHSVIPRENGHAFDDLFGESPDEDPTLGIKSEEFEQSMDDHPAVDRGATEEDEAASEPAVFPLQHLEELLSSGTDTQLEAGVEIGLEILQDLETPIAETLDAAMLPKWLDTMAKLRGQTKRERTVVAVVGGTGAGKSSLINAVLEEERILPTNGVRACTAVITEISYNDSSDPGERYRAEVEAISRDEWKQELRILYDELVDPDGGDSDAAAVAWAKFKAVYPKKAGTKSAVSGLNFEDLINGPDIEAFLGTTKDIRNKEPKAFYAAMQTYLDSKDKPGSYKDDEMALWPLIKAVRIYVRAEALSTGVVLVDLPGVHDSNAARSALADRYMAQCSAIWVVSPIMRAVDDKAARDLLGSSFRLQLHLDGNHSNVTFICSKTDDISVEESAETLDDGGRLEQVNKAEEAMSKELDTKTQLHAQLRERNGDLSRFIREQNDIAKAWERLAKKAEKQKEVQLTAKLRDMLSKRKRQSIPSQPRKRRRAQQPVHEVDSSDDDEIPTKITKKGVESKLARAQEEFEQYTTEYEQNEKQIHEIEALVNELQHELGKVRESRLAVYIQLRNLYSREAIRSDFAAGIKGMDDDVIASQAPGETSTQKPSRDYNRIAESLPVFCISSRGYQSLRGRANKDAPIKGYPTVEDTEIPMLQKHALSLTESHRVIRYKSFLNSLREFLTVLLLYTTDKPPAVSELNIKLSDNAQDKEMKNLESKLERLNKGLNAVANNALCSIADTLKSNVFCRYHGVTAAAVVQAPCVVDSWNRPVNEGGLYWGTYRSICRNDGVTPARAKKPRDFNEDLAELFKKPMAPGWSRAFHNDSGVAQVVEMFANTFNQMVVEFHASLKKRRELSAFLTSGIGLLLDGQIQGHCHGVKDFATTLRANMDAAQREANRLINPVIREQMSPAYRIGGAESGTGCTARMKETLRSHVDRTKDGMYHAAGQRLRVSLDGACQRVSDDMHQKVDDVMELLGSSYRTVIIGTDAIEASRAARDRLREILEDVDEKFVDAFDADVDEPDVKPESDDHLSRRGRMGADSDDDEDEDNDDDDDGNENENDDDGDAMSIES